MQKKNKKKVEDQLDIKPKKKKGFGGSSSRDFEVLVK